MNGRDRGVRPVFGGGKRISGAPGDKRTPDGLRRVSGGDCHGCEEETA
ncbi:hypothetical protein [Otoolea muris]|nr:hypothetical protein [Otoolea muris]